MFDSTAMAYHLTFFPPATPTPGLSDKDHAAAHARQLVPEFSTEMSLSELHEVIMSSAVVGRKGDAGYITACTVNGSRAAANCGAASYALIDYDDAPPDWAQLDQYQGFAWTTASHMKDGKPHWRVLIPFDIPSYHGKLRCPFEGGHIRNRSQPAFLPTHDTDVALIEWRKLGGSASLIAAQLGGDERERPEAQGHHEQTLVYDLCVRAGIARGGGYIECPWGDHDQDGRTGVMWDENDPDPAFGHFNCFHGKCSKRTTSDLVEQIVRAHPSPAVDEWTRMHMPQELKPEPLQIELRAASEERKLVLSGMDLDGPIPPVNWLCQDLQLCPGRPPILAADSGAGKSWAVQSLAMSVASGQPVFGAFACRQGPVLHVSQDSSINATRRRYQRLARGMGLKLKDLPIAVWNKRLTLTDRYGRFDKSTLAELDAEVTRGGYVLVILDSLATICAGLEENSVEVAAPLWTTIDPSCVWLWTHHTTKAGDSMRGSSAIKAAAGAVWGIQKTDKEREWSLIKACEETDGRLPDPFITRWVQDGEAARIEVANLSGLVNGPRAERPEERMAREILAAVREGRAKSKNALVEVVRGKRAQILAVCKELTVSGRLNVLGNGSLIIPLG